MKFKLPNTFSQNQISLARKSGYIPIHDRISNKNSYVRKLTNQHYPRFHLYISESNNEITFDLHLDQNMNRYQNQTAHNADHDSREVKQELIRIYQSIKEFLA